MQRLKLIALLFALMTLACSLTASPAAADLPTPTPEPSPTKPPQLTGAPSPQPSPPGTPAGMACIVTAQALNMRSCPDVACAVLGWLYVGQALTVISPGDWLKVQSSDGLTGYVNSDFCR